MSNISDLNAIKKRHDLAVEKYGEPPEGCTPLWATQDSADDLYLRIEHMAGLASIKGEEGQPSFTAPRYGLMSLLLQTTPCFIYNHPRFNAYCKTAFTDGTHIFINQDFYDMMLDDEDASNGTEQGVEPLIMHELSHKLLDHGQRLRQFDSKIANKAADLSINTRLALAYPEMRWVPSLRDTGLGFAPGDSEKYPNISEESIARELTDEDNKKKRQGNQQGQGQGQGKGQSPGGGKGKSGGQGQGQQSQTPLPVDQQDDPSESGSDQPEPPGRFGEEGDNHIITPQELIEMLEEAGLDEVKDLLGLPDSDDIEAIGKMEADSREAQNDACLKAAADAANRGGKYPGQHMLDHAMTHLKNQTAGKIQWKLAIRQLMFGDGQKYAASMEEPAEIAYVDEVEEALGTPLYLPVELPHKSDEVVLVVIDTSGSVSESDLKAFISEIIELKQASANMGDAASEVIVIFADTTIRNGFFVVDDSNIGDIAVNGMPFYGRGGTDLEGSLAQALKLPVMEEKSVRSFIYFTDLYDTAPVRKNLPLPPEAAMLFVAPSSTPASHIEKFARDVADFADVVEIREGAVADIQETTLRGSAKKM